MQIKEKVINLLKSLQDKGKGQASILNYFNSSNKQILKGSVSSDQFNVNG